MRILLTFISFIFLSLSAQYAQDNACATRTTENDLRVVRQMEALASQSAGRLFQDATIKVVMYRLRNDDGSGARSDSAFAVEINNLNTFYAAHDICFSLMRIENIDNSAYLNPMLWANADSADSLKSVINSDNPSFNDALTIYVLPPAIWYRGSSYGIPSTALLMTSNTAGKWGTSHIAHEVGHCLGNFHTHDDSDGANLEIEPRFCPLFPPLPNDVGLWFDCCLGADLLCDTPSDPKLSDTTSYGTQRIISGTCTYSDTTATDIFGNHFNPDVSNIMSYAPTNCRTNFSGMQGDRLHLTLDLNAEWNNKQADNNRQLNDEIISSGHRHELAKLSIEVANSANYKVDASGEVVHESEGVITLHPGFTAKPGTTSGFYVARTKDLCNNSAEVVYSYH